MKISELIQWLVNGIKEEGDIPVSILSEGVEREFECNEDITPVIVVIRTDDQGEPIKTLSLTSNILYEKYFEKGEDTDAAS